VICYTGHGRLDIPSQTFRFSLASDGDFSDKDLMQMLVPEEGHLRPLDGKQDVLLVLSCCHSGGFGSGSVVKCSQDHFEGVVKNALAPRVDEPYLDAELVQDVSRYMLQYEQAVKSLTVIAAVTEEGENSFIPPLSDNAAAFTPIMRFVCEAFEEHGQDLTPQRLFHFIRQGSDNPILLSDGSTFCDSLVALNQGSEPCQPVQKGCFAQEFPLHPVLRPYA